MNSKNRSNPLKNKNVRAAQKYGSSRAPSKAELIERRKAIINAPSAYGHFSDSGRGFGFVSLCKKDGSPLENAEKDYFVPPFATSGAVDGDFVSVRRFKEGERGYGQGNEAEVLAILERALTHLTGIYTAADRTVTSSNGRIKALVKGGLVPCDGDKVKVKITAYPDKNHIGMTGEVERNFGSSATREANYAAILDEAGIPRDFPDEVVAEAEGASDEALSPAGRLDLREKRIFTIDGAGAKDLDDAVSLEVTETGWQMGVHIADVSHYVRPNTAVDAEAYARGTSVYFTDKVVPMLPVALSNGACSLNGGVDRYALSALIDLNRRGIITGCVLHKSIIRSAVRGVYTEVNDVIENGDASEFAAKYAPVRDMLGEMTKLYAILAKNAVDRGAAELESVEPVILLDENGMPVDIVTEERGTAEKLIEQFMLTANEAVAAWLKRGEYPALYRVHELPNPEKISAFTIFAENLGLPVTEIREVLNAKGRVDGAKLAHALNAAVEAAKAKGIGEAVSGVLLRSLAKAKYSPTPLGHFGLALEDYCHFTSPIRRYPDLFVHRAVTAALEGDANTLSAMRKKEAEAGVVCSENEVRAMTAERSIEDLYMCIYMQGHLGETFDAVVTGVTRFGLFARTDKYCEGLVPIASMPECVYDETNYRLKLAVGSGSWTLGDKITVKAVAADVASGKITFEPVK